MSTEWWVALASAAWAGILTAISPCPLATNIAAISFIGRRVASPRAALLTGLLYTMGRSLVYVMIAAILVFSVLSAPVVSSALQKYMNQLLGPILIVVGMVLLGLIGAGARGYSIGEKVGKRVSDWGVWSGFALGAVFALSFCPASAALYFAGLIPLAIKYESIVWFPVAYGVSTALPVVLFAVLVALSTRAMAIVFDKVTGFEKWARRVTGVIFIALGVYFSLTYIFVVF